MNRWGVLLLFLISLSACVSVNLSSGKTEKAANLTFKEPAAPFKKISNANIDLAWQNPSNGNTLGFLSECNSKTDISLKTLEQDSLSALSNLKVLQSKNIQFNDREALKTYAEGFVDGVAIKMNVLVLKKNDCNYTISFVGRKINYESDKDIFEKFIEEFKAP